MSGGRLIDGVTWGRRRGGWWSRQILSGQRRRSGRRCHVDVIVRRLIDGHGQGCWVRRRQHCLNTERHTRRWRGRGTRGGLRRCRLRNLCGTWGRRRHLARIRVRRQRRCSRGRRRRCCRARHCDVRRCWRRWQCRRGARSDTCEGRLLARCRRGRGRFPLLQDLLQGQLLWACSCVGCHRRAGRGRTRHRSAECGIDGGGRHVGVARAAWRRDAARARRGQDRRHDWHLGHLGGELGVPVLLLHPDHALHPAVQLVDVRHELVVELEALGGLNEQVLVGVERAREGFDLLLPRRYEVGHDAPR